MTAEQDAIPGGDTILGAIGVLLQVTGHLHHKVIRPANDAQATKGVSRLYDAVDDLLREVLVYLQRLKIHLEPPATQRSALKNILVDALIRVLMVLAIATKYCNLAVTGVPWYKRVLLRRTSESRTLHVCRNVLLTAY